MAVNGGSARIMLGFFVAVGELILLMYTIHTVLFWMSFHCITILPFLDLYVATNTVLYYTLTINHVQQSNNKCYLISINNYQSPFRPNTLLASIMLLTQTNNFYMYTITKCKVVVQATFHARCSGRKAARTSSSFYQTRPLPIQTHCNFKLHFNHD